MQDLEIREALHPDSRAIIIAVTGYIDTHTAGDLERALTVGSRGDTPIVVLDLTEVDYISSAGWGAMIGAVRQLREKGSDLRLVGMQSEVREVFELLEFPSILRAFANADDAMALALS